MLLGPGSLLGNQLGDKGWHRAFLPLSLKCFHVISSSQVHWNGGDVHYHLESQPPGPFNVDAEGRIHVTTELDREAQAEVRREGNTGQAGGCFVTSPTDAEAMKTALKSWS